jgi:hypothetical protein
MGDNRETREREMFPEHIFRHGVYSVGLLFATVQGAELA